MSSHLEHAGDLEMRKAGEVKSHLEKFAELEIEVEVRLLLREEVRL